MKTCREEIDVATGCMLRGCTGCKYLNKDDEICMLQILEAGSCYEYNKSIKYTLKEQRGIYKKYYNMLIEDLIEYRLKDK